MANCQRSARLSIAYCDAFSNNDSADRKPWSIKPEGSYMIPNHLGDRRSGSRGGALSRPGRS